jgi:hypothetical protein
MPNVAVDTEMPSNLGLSNIGGGITSWSWSFNNVAGTLLYVAAALNDQAGVERVISGVTYDAVAMAKPTGATRRSGWNAGPPVTRDNEASLWALSSPSTGNKTVAITFNAAVGVALAAAVSLTGHGTAAANVTTVFDQDAHVNDLGAAIPGIWGGMTLSWYQSGTDVGSSNERASATFTPDGSTRGSNGYLGLTTCGGGPVNLKATLNAPDWLGLVAAQVLPVAFTPTDWVDQRERLLLAPHHLGDDGLC